MEPTRLFDLLAYQQAKFPKTDALASKVNNNWVSYSTAEYQQKADALSWGLLQLGIVKDDKIAIISHNRPEWNIVDMATQQLGAISVPMYPTITEQDFRFIFTDAEVKIIFVGDKDLYQKAKNASKDLPFVKEIYTFNEVEQAKNWKDITASLPMNVAELDRIKATVSDQDVVTLIYTSGTTGSPKGVMLTHHNIIDRKSVV